MNAAFRCSVDWSARSRAACIQAEASRPEGDDREQSAHHGDVLKEMDQLVLISEVAAERERCRKSEGGKTTRNQPGSEAGDE